ncbi:DUF488 family protein [Pseudarthrobacter sp. So.54]
MTDMTIFTVGHSTHPIDEFLGLLRAHGVKKLIDVRTVPKSRHNPQFNEDSLAASVRAAWDHLPPDGFPGRPAAYQ